MNSIISVNPKFVITTITALTGLVGAGYCMGRDKKTRLGSKTDERSVENSSLSKSFKSTEFETAGQADAVIVDTVNALRIDHLLKRILNIDKNKAGAEEEIRILKSEVRKLLTTNRGGNKGIHGFIGETSQVHIANVKAFTEGNEPLYILLDDNSMTDYCRGMQIIQQKACQANGYLGLDAIKRHMLKYPEFVKHNGIYQIPKDMYEKYEWLKNLPDDVALKLQREDLRCWRYIKNFTKEYPDAIIEPMEVGYADIQAGNIKSTIHQVENSTEKKFDRQYKDAHEEYAPTFKEFAKVCGISAAIEGGIYAGTEFILKLKAGKKLSEFTKQDFKDIRSKLIIGCGSGAFRSSVIYMFTNIYQIPAALISGMITALIGITHESYLLIKRKVNKKEFVRNSIFISTEAAASSGGATLGKYLCKKHPIIGSIAGSILGSASVKCFYKITFA